MTQSPLNADTKRARLQCYLAASVFAGCAVLFIFVPIAMPAAVKWVVAGFNAIIALAVFLYGKQLTVEPTK
ncbi:MAG: hypothetical protein ABW223_01785 [Rariglobus sp.]